jgi:hypothetical protein
MGIEACGWSNKNQQSILNRYIVRNTNGEMHQLVDASGYLPRALGGVRLYEATLVTCNWHLPILGKSSGASDSE